MFNISIVKVPRGEAPEWVREAWLGIVLPCIGKFPSNFVVGVLSGKSTDCKMDVYDVAQDVALAALNKEQPVAANWWRSNGFPKKDRVFSFREDEIVVLIENP